jgi:hypothetical protein
MQESSTFEPRSGLPDSLSRGAITNPAGEIMNTETTSAKDEVAKEKLMHDLSIVVADAEEL